MPVDAVHIGERMTGIKKIARRLVRAAPVAGTFINPVLRAHSAAYKLAGHMATALERDGVHPKHRLMDYHGWFAARLDPGWRVLDVGCGNGALAAELSRYCGHVTAIDIDPDNIRMARRKNARENIAYIVGDATTHRFDGSFDAVVLSNVLEHIEDRAAFLKRLSRLSGRFLVRVPMVDRDWITLYKKERGLPWRLDDSHFVEYTFDLLKKEMSSARLGIVEHRVRYGELYAVCEKTGGRNRDPEGRAS